MSDLRRVTILGCTGSIGTSALDVIEHANKGGSVRFEIEAMAAGSDVAGLADLALHHRPKQAVIADESKLAELRERLAGTNIGCSAGDEAINEAAATPCDRVLASIVGAAGLPSTLAAIQAGNSVAIANKESIVCAGELILREAADRGVDVVPVDSEHNAIFQAMQSGKGVEKLTITASGGPFRTSTLDEMRDATPDMAKAHPVWDMGIKNSIDSATLMNKALEFIEAAYLFDMPEDQIEIVVHPQSIVHGMVHYADGSVIAELNTPDMRIPIAHALAWPERVETTVKKLDLASIGALHFEPVDDERFPAVNLARAALRFGKGAPAVLNSANEEAVSAFVQGRCRFLEISVIVEKTLEAFIGGDFANVSPETLADVLALDDEARKMARSVLKDMQAGRVERSFDGVS